MVSKSIELGRRYFCREETTGQHYTGTFCVEADDMFAWLYAFTGHISDDFEDLLVLRLEDNRIASLHNNFVSGGVYGGTANDQPSPESRCITTNIVVVGDDVWKADDPILRVEFTIQYADGLMQHNPKHRAVAKANFFKMPDLTLFELETTGQTVSVFYAPSGNITFRHPTAIGIGYAIEFQEPVHLGNYLTAVHTVVEFVSAVLGHHFVPSDIRISRQSLVERIEEAKSKTFTDYHRVHYTWHGEEPTQSLWVGRSFGYAGDKRELDALIACLRVWIERGADWKDANSLMMAALKLESAMSGDRLLNACKWLEQIPGAASAIAVSRADIDIIAAVAAAEAERLGHKDYKDRIAGVIRGQLKTESNAERFERLRKLVCARFDKTILNPDILPHLMAATQFRGRVAHGVFEPVDEAEFQAFMKAVHAMEALCFLLTIRELPMTKKGAQRAAGHTFVQSYHLAMLGQ